MDMTTEQRQEQERERSKRNYQERKNVNLDALRERYSEEIQEAISGKHYVNLSKKELYRRCQLCKHYADLTYYQQISPQGNIVEDIQCPRCEGDLQILQYATGPEPDPPRKVW
jgi:Zn finger protein HypA/HybF involved in hydrogenase expression